MQHGALNTCFGLVFTLFVKHFLHQAVKLVCCQCSTWLSCIIGQVPPLLTLSLGQLMSHISASTTYFVTMYPFTHCSHLLARSLTQSPVHLPVHGFISLLLVQGDRGHLAELLSKQAFRMDAISFTATVKRHASISYFDNFVLTSSQLGVVASLKANLDANRHTTVNERAAVNSMLVLNKIRMVGSCPIVMQGQPAYSAVCSPLLLLLLLLLLAV